jgi:hypothetical protein
MYLNPAVRQAISNLARLDPAVVTRMTANLARDLRSGAWRSHHGSLLDLEELDCGYRLLVANPG